MRVLNEVHALSASNEDRDRESTVREGVKGHGESGWKLVRGRWECDVRLASERQGRGLVDIFFRRCRRPGWVTGVKAGARA